MKILLIPPTFKYASEYPALLSVSDFPTAFGYLAAVLKQAGHEVIGFNPNNIPGYVNAETMLRTVLPPKLLEIQPDLIGIGGLCTDYKFLKDVTALIRQTLPQTPIVLGGQIVSNDAEDVVKLLKPDYAIEGDGEAAMVALANGKIGAKHAILKGELSDLNSLPFPDYEPFGINDMMEDYSMATRLLYRYTRQYPRLYGIVTARGCPFFCSFCIDHHRGYRERSIENVMEEIRVMYEQRHFNILLILDELFAVKTERMREFCNAVLKGKQEYGWDFDWCFQTHASAKLDLDTLKLAKQAGCFSFSYGLESASPVVLASMNKRIEPAQVVEAIHLAQQTGIGFSANLIFGDVAETQDTIAESLCFWLQHGRDAFIFLSTIAPYPGSALFKSAQARLPDKRAYYENIDKSNYNLTTIPEREYRGLLNLIQMMEQTWLFNQVTPIKKLELLDEEGILLKLQGGNYYRITADCPYCGEEIVYRERLLNDVQPFWIGTGCPKCNRRIKVVK